MKKLIAFVLMSISLAVAAVAILGSGCDRPLAVRPTSTVVYVDEAAQVREALDRTFHAAVTLRVLDSDDGDARGSGALIGEVNSVSAWVLTAAHVVTPDNGAQITSLVVTLADSRRLPGRVWRADVARDLAVVEVTGDARERPLRLAPHPPRLMERVWNFGTVDEYAGQVGAGRWGPLRPARKPAVVRAVTGAFFWPGMSGGPVVDDRGDVVGVAVLVHATDAPFGDDDSEQIIMPMMGAAADWQDVRDFLKEAGL